MNQDLLLQYVEACRKLKEADAEKTRLALLVQTHLRDDLKLEKLQTDVGTFSLAKRVSYEYPAAVKEGVQKLLDQAVQDGSAELKSSEFLRFQAVK